MPDQEESDTMTILDLPPEIILQIFSLIDVRSLFKFVILTCKHFHEMLSVDGIWKTLFALKWKEFSIADDLSYIRDWRDICYSYEDIERCWKNESKRKLRTSRLAGHFAPVDAVHILSSGNICISGSRDRSVLVWDLSNVLDSSADNEVVSNICVLHGHKGWVWSIDSDKNKPNEVITASWDKSLRVWDLNAEGALLNSYNYHPAAILGLCCHDNVYTTACYDKTVRTFDPRSEQVVIQSKHHKRPVLNVAVTEKFILSGSEDQTIGVYDVRAGKLFSTLRTSSPVLCMNLANDQGFNYIRAGGNDGNFYLFDMTDDRFTLLNSTQLWHQHKLTQLANFRGSLVACSQAGIVRMYTPDRKTRFLEKFDSHTGDVASVHARGNILATGGSDCTVLMWNLQETVS